ncbi:MAG TPA: DUF1501 domain-containing protein, partial [Gemmatales bacterium]|nr:DUF1501 domain-containing protein [Gemmatales bacterium]
MLTFLGRPFSLSCDGATRRDFLKIGTLGIGTFTLADLLRSRARATGSSRQRTMSIVWLWLGGGATHVETFDPKRNAPAEYRSITGEVKTTVPGVTMGGTLPRLAR